jgi:O-antigen/teichoic acid export membrane protein
MAGNFIKNTSITFVARVAVIVIGILTTVVIARSLGPQGQGVYSLATLLPALILVFANLGLGTAAVFHAGKKEYAPEVVFGGSLIFAVLISIVAVAAGATAIVIWGQKLFPDVSTDYLLLALSLLPFYIFFDLVSSILLGLQKIVRYNLIVFLQPLFYFILISVFLLGWRYGVGAAILCQTASFAVAGAILFYFVKKTAGRPSFKLEKKYFKNVASYGFKSCLASVFNFLHYRADLFLINIFMNPAATGIYYAATRVAEGIWLLSTSAGTVLFPRVAAETDAVNLKNFTPFVCRSVFFATIVLAVLAMLASRWLINLLYSDAFIGAVYPLQVLLVGSVFISGWRILANDIAARGKPMINTYTIGASLLMNVVLNIFWIPKFGIVGAAYATATSYLFLFAITVFAYGKISANRAASVLLLQKDDFNFYRGILLSVMSVLRKNKKSA